MQLIAIVLDMCCFLPLFLMKLHFGIWAVALSQVISQSIPMIILMVLLWSGKLSIKIKFSMLFNKFSNETKNALKVGFASFVLNLSEAFPEFAMQKFIILVADHVNLRDPVLASWYIFGCLYSISLCVMIAFDSAYMPSASYAYGKRQYKRIVKLTLHSLWITLVYASIISSIIIIFPTTIPSFFTKDEQILGVFKNYLWLAFLSIPLYPIPPLVISFFQAIKRPTPATIISLLTTLIPMPVFSAIFYYTHPSSLRWIYSTYIAADILSGLIAIIGILPIFIKLSKLNDGDKFDDEEKADENQQQSVKSIESITN